MCETAAGHFLSTHLALRGGLSIRDQFSGSQLEIFALDPLCAHHDVGLRVVSYLGWGEEHSIQVLEVL